MSTPPPGRTRRNHRATAAPADIRHRLRLPLLLAMIAVSACFPASLPAQAVRIEPRYTPGRVLYIEDQATCWFSLVPEGLDDPDAALFVADVTLGVLERVESAGGGVRLHHTIDRVAIAFRGLPAVALQYDSDLPGAAGAARPPAPTLRRLLGQSYVVTLDVEGEVMRIDGAERLRAAVVPHARVLPALQPLLIALSDEQIRMRCGPGGIGIASPGRRLDRGDTWDRDTIEPFATGGALRAHYVYRLTAIDSKRGRRIARIELHGTFRPAAPPLRESTFGALPQRLLDGTLDGRADYDVARGRFTRVTTRARLTLIPTVPAGAAEDLHLHAATRRTRVVMSRGKRAQLLRQRRRQ